MSEDKKPTDHTSDSKPGPTLTAEMLAKLDRMRRGAGAISGGPVDPRTAQFLRNIREGEESAELFNIDRDDKKDPTSHEGDEVSDGDGDAS